jgi:orotate phosphoribosyltransferase
MPAIEERGIETSLVVAGLAAGGLPAALLACLVAMALASHLEGSDQFAGGQARAGRKGTARHGRRRAGGAAVLVPKRGRSSRHGR